jgi:hypothetical protein
MSADEGTVRREVIAALTDPGFEFTVDPFKRRLDKVVIVGFTDHRTEAFEAPYNDGTWERWGLNELYRYTPLEEYDRWFEVHGRAYLEKDEDGKKHMQDLGSDKFRIPIYMQQTWDDIPASVRFPKDELIGRLGSEYWTNCPAWMIGMAIAMGYRSIHVCGIDMAQDTEYAQQRPCCEYWLGYARGKGIEVSVADTSDLMAHVGVYGYEGSGSKLSRKLRERLAWLHREDNARLKILRGMDGEYQRQRTHLITEMERARGAMMELSRLPKIASRTARIEALDKHVGETQAKLNALEAEYQQKHAAVMAERNQIVGGIQNVDYLLRSWMVRADGDGPGIPDRTKDPRTGIVGAPSGDDKPPSQPEVIETMTVGA